MANADDYIRASDSANDFADAEIEKLEQPALEEIDYLMTNPDGRDAEFWDSLGVDEELTLDDYDAVDDDDRDLDWVLGMAGLSAAATTQFFLDSRDKTIIRPLAYREQEVGELIITRTELLRAARRGFDIEGTATFAKLQKQFIDELGFIKQLDNRELYTLLQEAGAIQPIDKMIASNAGYVSRMTNYRPGSPQLRGPYQT